ncbi:GYD domain-containing protein [Pseudonocardia acidicola]|uniref:GYD domain-containing protein n=1 Tax=Pseudonocardia acidicola TaxID=2724939 RepID=A0ABX1SHF6_9PSEU|nr:GYD domain-containing protein [Pseudonocardia acidicola]NMI00208.1 GYD domain-containing protein [Pseudonocardia acidicola]
MATHVLFFSYTPQTWDRMITKPEDRTAAVRALAEAVGGRLESLYFMFGERDGLVLFDAPGPQEAAAVSVAVSSTGAFSHMETRQLIAPGDLAGVLEKAAAAREAYRPPGS